MSFDKEAIEGIKLEAARINVEWAALAAVAEVESAGKPLWDGLCPIRIEGHYFDKRLSGTARDTARAQGLSSPTAGKVTNPSKMADRYAKLEKMKAIDESAALESCSWGLGQVMGAHWQSLGYADVQALVAEAQGSVAGQIRLMVRFIEVNHLDDELRSKDWPAFAEKYNGKGYKGNNYDVKMAEAYKRFSDGGDDAVSDAIVDDEILERGDKGPKVRTLQTALQGFGYYLGKIDGLFGGGTETAVMEFQRDAGIQIDGRAGPITHGKLKDWKKSDTTKAKAEGRADVVYKNQHAIRNRPCTPNLEVKLAEAVFAVFGAGFQAQIYSGGQPKKGNPGKRTGSIRHDDYGDGGRALDAWIFDASGKKLTGTTLGRLGQYWLAKKYGGCGLEMAVGGIHLDEWTTPPPGGGMYWMYPYAMGQSWGKKVQQMLVDGSRGIMP